MIVTTSNGPEFIANAIKASTLFTDAGLVIFDPEHPELGSGIVVDNGFDADGAGVARAISPPGKGLCIVVEQFFDGTVADQINGKVSHKCRFKVGIREAVALNRSNAGTGINMVQALEEVIKSVIAFPTDSPVFRRMQAGDYKNLGLENGTRNCAVFFTIPAVIQ